MPLGLMSVRRRSQKGSPHRLTVAARGDVVSYGNAPCLGALATSLSTDLASRPQDSGPATKSAPVLW